MKNDRQNSSGTEKAFLEIQQRYERMVNTMPVMLYDSFIASDQTSRFLYVAPGPCREILELDPDALLKDMSLVWDIVHPDDLARFYQEDLIANKVGQEFLSEVRIITPSGHLKWLLVNSRPNPSEPGEPIVWSGYLQDITARKQAEERLHETEQKLRLIVENSTNLFYMHTIDHVFTYINPQFRQFFDCEPDEAVVRWMDFLTDNPVNSEAVRKTQRAIDTGKRQPPYQVECMDKKGRKIWVEVHETPIIENGNTVAISGTLTDITKRKQTEEALRESEFFFKEAQRLACIGSYKADLMTGCWSSSEVLDEIFGIGPDYDRSFQGWFARVHPDDREMLERYLKEEVIAHRKAFDREYRIIRDNDGEERWVSGLGALKTEENGRGLLLMGTIQDITEQKKREVAEAKLEAQLHQTQKIESIGQLAGGVAHDFNNMLGVILGHAELALRKAPHASPMISDLEEICKAANRSAELTRQLMTFARKQIIAPKVLDLNDAIAGMLKMLHRLIGENIQISWNPATELWPIKVDPSQVNQILANLCVNSRDAISDTGKISIKTANTSWDKETIASRPYDDVVPGDYVLLSVSDDGCGMEKEVQAHIFEPFYTTKELGTGTGLGLATVYGAVKQNNGFLTVYSEPGLGTVFNIYLPRTSKAVEAKQERTEKPLLRGTETVLLVEDDKMLLGMMTSMLEERGYTVLATLTTDLAQTLAKEHPGPIHLLISDVIMPVMNGKELSENLKNFRPEMKVLFMSGYTADILSNKNMNEGGIHFLQKPFSFEALTVKVRETLDFS